MSIQLTPSAVQVAHALRDGNIHAWFQPLVNLHDRSAIGFETLARWIDSDGNALPAAQFIPVAEQAGLTADLDAVILTDALIFLGTVPEAYVSVNVSARTLSDPDFPCRVHAALEASGITADRLNLEVTETSILELTWPTHQNIIQIAGMGVSWWVDDFGTGFSSLSHLRDLPISGLKLDRSFVDTIHESRTFALIDGILSLANRMGLHTVAEGIETEEQAAALARMGWSVGQGWLFAPGMPAGHAREFLSR